MTALRNLLFLWLANCVPDFFALRVPKGLLLRLAGVRLNPLAMYFISALRIDRPLQVSIGKGVFINRNCTFEGQGKIVIGNQVQIGPNVILATTNHTLGQMKEQFGDIRILDNVWIGANAVIVQGVTLGPNVIVGAGAVVTRSFADCSVAGVPARPLPARSASTAAGSNNNS